MEPTTASEESVEPVEVEVEAVEEQELTEFALMVDLPD